LATLVALYREKQIELDVVRRAMIDLKIDAEKLNPIVT
jgi:hypothetical protein